MPEHLSMTQISMLQRCPTQYEWRYVKGKIVPPGVALVEGGSHHKVLETMNRGWIKKKRWMKLGDAQELFTETWRKEQEQIEDWGEEEPERVVVRGRRLLEEYCRKLRPHTDPVGAESYWEAIVAGQKVIGYIDMIQSSRHIFEYKVLGRMPSMPEMTNHFQLAVYQAVSKAKQASLVVFNKKKEEVVGFSMDYNRDWWLRWLEFTVERCSHMIKAGSFPPCGPDNWCCSDKWCGYYRSCRGAKRKATRSTRAIEVTFDLNPSHDRKESRRGKKKTKKRKA